MVHDRQFDGHHADRRPEGIVAHDGFGSALEFQGIGPAGEVVVLDAYVRVGRTMEANVNAGDFEAALGWYVQLLLRTKCVIGL